MTEQQFVDEVNQALTDLIRVNQLLWATVFGAMEQDKNLPAGSMAGMMDAMMAMTEKTFPTAENMLGERRLDIALLSAIKDALSSPDKSTPPWTPRVILGGQAGA